MRACLNTYAGSLSVPRSYKSSARTSSSKPSLSRRIICIGHGAKQLEAELAPERGDGGELGELLRVAEPVETGSERILEGAGYDRCVARLGLEDHLERLLDEEGDTGGPFGDLGAHAPWQAPFAQDSGHELVDLPFVEAGKAQPRERRCRPARAAQTRAAPS